MSTTLSFKEEEAFGMDLKDCKEFNKREQNWQKLEVYKDNEYLRDLK